MVPRQKGADHISRMVRHLQVIGAVSEGPGFDKIRSKQDASFDDKVFAARALGACIFEGSPGRTRWSFSLPSWFVMVAEVFLGVPCPGNWELVNLRELL